MAHHSVQEGANANEMFVRRFNASPDQDAVPAHVLRKEPTARPGAEWERPPSPRVHSEPTPSPVPENGAPESLFALRYQQQQLGSFQSIDQQKPPEGAESETTLSPSPAHSLDADLDIPMETDIDDFQEEDGLPAEDEPLTSELPCYALPVTVLETDVDALAEDTEESGVQEEEEEEPEAGGVERLSLEELFPHGSEAESGMESWRGAEPSTDSLDR